MKRVRFLCSSTTPCDTDILAEWEFVQSLAYKEQTPEDADFMRLIYTSRLRKYKHAEEHALTRRRLVKEFGLSDNPDVLFSFADALYAQFRWSDCYAITSRYDLSSRPPDTRCSLVGAEYWAWWQSTHRQCLYILRACITYHIYTPSSSYLRMSSSTANRNLRRAGMPLGCGT